MTAALALVQPSRAPPFVILGLPRSRTAWLSRFLSYGGRVVGHDIAIDCGGVDDFLGALRAGRAGTVETGMAAAWPVLRRRLPDSRLVVVRRAIDAVVASLARQGVTGVDQEIAARAAALDRLSGCPGVVTIQYPALEDASVGAWLFRHCLGISLNPAWWAALTATNIQVNLPAELARVTRNAARIARFKAEVMQQLPPAAPRAGAVVSVEPFGSIYPECVDLGRQHWSEVETESDPRRAFNLDRAVLSAASVQGALLTVAARLEGRLVGYIFWTLQDDPESTGLLVADQGAWYVAPGAPRRTALALYERSLGELKAAGVKCVYPHHRTTGRGAGLGKFFRRRGAVPEKQTYSLWIGD